MSTKLQAIAVSGPTTDNNPNLTKFVFQNNKTIHQGVPDHFDFSWIITSPNTLRSKDPFYYNWK